jgi:predicted metal-dependent phosphotriesterase family hydrolase
MTPVLDHVMTVVGPISPDELGIVMTHEHLLLDLYRVFQPHREMKLYDVELAAAELNLYRSAGGRTIVEVTTPDLGRDPGGLKRISELTDVQVVMSAGWYREPFYSPDVWERSVRELTADLIRDVEVGCDGIRPGILGEIGTHGSRVSPVEERVHRAVARAHKATDLTITTHSNASPVGLAQLDIFEEEAVDLRRVVVGHCDTYPVRDYHLAVLERGAWVQFDTIRGNFDFETQRQARMIAELAELGHLDRLLLSQDIAVDRFYTVYGGNGYAYVVSQFVPKLREVGLSHEQIEILLVHNPRRMLVGDLSTV